MTQLDITQAKADISKLLELVIKGEEIVIAQDNKLNAILPFYHRDPFDRLIIAQSIAEDVPIISVDSVFNKYSANLID